MNNRAGIKLLVPLALLATFALAGCSDDDDPVSPGDGGKTALRVVHASPDAPPVDVYAAPADGGKASVLLFEDLAYGDASTYADVDPGDYTVELRAAGADPADPPAFATDVTITGGLKITAVAAGLLASGDEADSLRVLPLVENFSAPGAGNAAVRIVHASADAPAVAVDVGNDGNPELTNFDRFAATDAAGLPLPAGQALNIGIWAGDPLERVAVFTTPALPEGGEVFVIATGLVGTARAASTPFTLLAVTPDGALPFIAQNAPATVYALHASPNAPAVDIDADGSEIITNLSFGELSAPLQPLPGAYELSFRATGETTVAASVVTPYLEADTAYLAIATGFLGGNPEFQLLPLAEGFAAAGSDARVRVVHASPDAPAVDVGTENGGIVTPVPSWTNLAFGQGTVAEGTVVPVGNLSIGVAATGTTDALFTFPVTTVAGLRAFAVAAGSVDGSGGESFRLLLVLAGAADWTVAEVQPD
jgi:hypothetical protein